MKDFQQLIEQISTTHQKLQNQAASAVNQLLTIRNWLIGYYIVEYEQNGKDRAEYGDNLISKLAEKFQKVKGLDERSFRRFRLFYQHYPQVGSAIFSKLEDGEIWGTLSPDSAKPLIPSNIEGKPLIVPIQGTLTPESDLDQNRLDGTLILSKLSYSHLEELLRISDDLKRTFYEIECIKGAWSVRELRRQISSMYYERSGLSAKPEKLAKLTHSRTSPQNPTDIIKNIYAFEFLDLNVKDVVEESDLEAALLSHLQEFILELGNGFCFEARQKRILIGENYYFIDLLFYHRILKCHVLVELKIGEFNHGDIGQLNTYLNYFKEEVGDEQDKPPVGILLVAEKDHALVKYATAGMDENLFVQEYLVQLPAKEKLEKYIGKELERLQY